MPLMRMRADCSATVQQQDTGPDGSPLVYGDTGDPVLISVPAPAQLVEMAPEEEAAHLASEVALAAHAATITARTAAQQAALAALAAHATANPDDPSTLLAKALGLV